MSERKRWGPLYRGLGAGLTDVARWSDRLVRASIVTPTTDVVKAVLEHDPHRQLGPHLERGYRAAALAEAMHVARETYAATFKATLPDEAEEMALDFIEQEGARMVRGVTSSTRRAIQEAVAEGIRAGKGIDTIAREIRDTIGLTPRDSKAVRNYRSRLRRKGEKDDAQIKRLTSQYRKRKLNERAELIARTEMIRARNVGQDVAWQAALRAGEIEPTDKREWIAADPCEVCTRLDGQQAPLGEPFEDPGTGQRYERPPAHPRCKCSMALAIKT